MHIKPLIVCARPSCGSPRVRRTISGGVDRSYDPSFYRGDVRAPGISAGALKTSTALGGPSHTQRDDRQDHRLLADDQLQRSC